jgi:hypothetical protein
MGALIILFFLKMGNGDGDFFAGAVGHGSFRVLRHLEAAARLRRYKGSLDAETLNY